MSDIGAKSAANSFPAAAAVIAQLRAEDERRQQEMQAIERALLDAMRSLAITKSVLGRLCVEGGHGCSQDAPRPSFGEGDTSLQILRKLAEAAAEDADTITRQAHALSKQLAVT